MQNLHPDSDSGDFPGEWLDGTEWACAMEVTKETFVKTQQVQRLEMTASVTLVVFFCRWKGCGFSVDLKNKCMYIVQLLYIYIYIYTHIC